MTILIQTGGRSSTADQSLSVDAPAVSPNDEPIRVRVTGAAPGETVEFTAALTDADGTEWSSRATFSADDDGVVDLTEHAPDSGSWGGVEPMGWLWAMASDGDTPFARLAGLQRLDVRFRATTAGDAADRTITRVLHGDVAERSVDRDDVVGTLYLPADDGPHPGVIELHGSGGRRSDGTAKRLATEGYAALALTYFGDHDALSDELERIPLSYFDAAAAWLRAQPEVADGRVGLVGSSRGAELALVLCAHSDWVGAVASYAGSGVPWDTPSDAPAWLHDGEPVPHVAADDVPSQTDLDEKDLERAVPPVENTDGPILLLSGGDDRVWPARRLSELVVDRLDAHDFPSEYDHRSYEDTGHLIGTPYAPLSGIDETDRVGGTARGTVRASEDAWPAVLDTLATALRDGEN